MSGTWSPVSIPSYAEGVDLPNFMHDMWSFFKLCCEGFYPGFCDEVYSGIGFVSRAKTFTLPDESVGFSPLKDTSLHDAFFLFFLITRTSYCIDLYKQFLSCVL